MIGVLFYGLSTSHESFKAETFLNWIKFKLYSTADFLYTITWYQLLILINIVTLDGPDESRG